MDFNEYYVVSMAIMLRHEKTSKIYLREKYIFGVALVVLKSDYQARVVSEALRKLAFVFTHLENTRHIIYNHAMQEIVPMM